jgi:hypothetical protein
VDGRWAFFSSLLQQHFFVENVHFLHLSVVEFPIEIERKFLFSMVH